jgi:hypothetical protein
MPSNTPKAATLKRKSIEGHAMHFRARFLCLPGLRCLLSLALPAAINFQRPTILASGQLPQKLILADAAQSSRAAPPKPVVP